ncbi:MAG: 30S ribosomal protein S14 [Simkaniaceae bacterium]
MAKKSNLQRQLKRERLVALKWEKRQELKKLIRDPSLPEDQKLLAIDTLNKLPKNSSPTRLRNRCQLTGRPRGFLRKFKLSRICFRQMANDGLLPGITKSSW